MWMQRFPSVMRVVMTLLLGLALAGAGAAHRPLERPAEAAAKAAFLAAGGSLADLCHDAGSPGHRNGHGAMECPACVLQKCAMAAAEMALPAPVRGRLVLALWPVTRGQPVPGDPLILPPARGPPETTFS